MDNGNIIMLCGLPGAGKTTYAKKLERNLPAVRLCPDAWVAKLMMDKSNHEENERIRAIIEPIQWDLALKLAELGNTVILENGFWNLSERNRYRQSGEEKEISIELHYLKADKDILWSRIEARNENLPDASFHISKSEFEKWSKEFDEPKSAELELFTTFKIISS